MAQFTLNWINTAILASSNAINQQASYRPKTAGGSWITIGFDPPNDLDKTVNTTDSPVLSSNIVYEFRIQTLCTISGPTTNDNDVQDAISFACITPDIENTFEQSTVTLDVTGLDITKARFTLRKASDNSIIQAAVIVNRVGNSITRTKTGLLDETNYYWQVELYANINGVEVRSSSSAYLGSICSPYPFTTDSEPFCDPITSVDVTSIEIP